METNARHRLALALAGALLLSACAHTVTKPATVAKFPVSENFESRNYEQRTWVPPDKVPFDPIAVGDTVRAPVNSARTKILGPEYGDAVKSLAAKLWMIDNARYTIDAVYYIFKRDTVGYAVLGALCNAVRRGVDVRLMIDSGGSVHPTHSELDSLLTCADESGYVLAAAGQPTSRKARIQVVIVNAISKVFVPLNRRSHDKLLVVDGHARDRAMVMTGGRNVSVSYYGINEDGTPDPTAYQDMELILRPALDTVGEQNTVGDVSIYYYSLLFLNEGNKFVKPPAAGSGTRGAYAKERRKAQEKLEFLKNLPVIKSNLEIMPAFLGDGFSESKVRLAHELGNLTNRNAVTGAQENLAANRNSIQVIAGAGLRDQPPKRLRVVSPYLFLAEYAGDDAGHQDYDDVRLVQKLLAEHPDSIVEIVTNSALTSDNPFAQAVIDMETAPRLLLTPEVMKKWQEGYVKDEPPRELVESQEWRELVSNPRLRIYETGRIDAVEFGGKETYGKLHAKFIIADGAGFVGTDNFDYRSRLFNNEFGFFFKGDALYEDLNVEFDKLVAKSYAWGSPEWLEMRRALLKQGGIKPMTSRFQRWLFKVSRATGLEWLY
jgi:phosphatidylserine/phosphatidylglycerophosphate/cardiolipin synthase-like enzyme